MCGRFTQAQIAELDREIFKLLGVPPLEPRYNIAPTEEAAVVRAAGAAGAAGEASNRRLDLLRWGLIPSGASDPAIGNRLINARAETVAQKPSFRSAFKYRRCLVPADGFYEWQKTQHGKQPYSVRMAAAEVFALAGLWERWEGAAGGAVESFTIITTTPNELVERLHDRMPVILRPDEFDRWLDPHYRDTSALHRLLRPYPANEMTAHPVSRYVNKPENKGPECIDPIEL